MRFGPSIILFLILSFNNSLQAQAVLDKGTVSYVSSQNVYVKFASTAGINIGDTLFVAKNSAVSAALVVNNKSSVSCVCTRISADVFHVGDEIAARKVPEAPKPETPEPAVTKPAATGGKQPATGAGSTSTAAKPASSSSRQKIRARLSAASYSNLSDRGETTRMRYAFSMQGDHIKNSPFSTDVYVTYRHTLGDTAHTTLNDALKIYSLAGKFDFNESTNVVFGRKINPRISSLGAVDGLQFETGFGGHFLAGGIAGTRPDMLDYSINLDLMQAGVYVGHASKLNEKYQQTTLALIEQRNKSAVDRRFLYFQHSDDLLKSLNLFSSMEFDLYQNVNSEVRNKLSLTNMFVSLRYKFSRQLNISLSYDNRKNIIYYESYKNYIDQIIENETRQGLRFGTNLRIGKQLFWGANASWRFQKSNANDSKNLNTYLNYNLIPGIKASASLSANFLQTSYIRSRILGLRLTKDIFKGKFNVEAYYRRVDYSFPVYEYSTNQNVVGGSLSWQILKKLSLYVYAEQTLDSQHNNYLLLNTRIMQRF